MVNNRINGLILFIADIRECVSPEAEHARIIQELAKIRQKLVDSKKLSGYERKKACWKLVYCYLLGYNIDFGHTEIVQLLASTKYTEKCTGYVASSLLFTYSPELVTLCVNTMKLDISGPNPNFAALALHTYSFLCTYEMAETIINTLQNLLTKVTPGSEYLRKKAVMCILQTYKRFPDLLDIDFWKNRIIELFYVESSVSCLLSLCSLIIAFLEVEPNGWEILVSRITEILTSCANDAPPNIYTYYGSNSPWLQIKLLRILQFFPIPTELLLLEYFNNFIRKAINKYPTQSLPMANSLSKMRSRHLMEAMNAFNIGHAILFESINLGIHLENSLDLEVKELVIAKLGSLLKVKEQNSRYITLDAMARMSYDPVAISSLKYYTQDIITQLRDPDNSIKRQALNLLYSLCDNDNWEYIITELLNVLKEADKEMQEEIVLKIAILVEKNAPDLTGYVNVIFEMFEAAPAHIAEDIWYRVVQVVTGFGESSAPIELQVHAAKIAFDYLSIEFVHEPVVKMGAYILGEFGHQISKTVNGIQILDVLKAHFYMVGNITKGIILMAYAKLANVFPDIQDEISELFEKYEDTLDIDLQTRACEFSTLLSLKESTIERILGMMPAYSDSIQNNNPLITRLKQSAKTRAQSRLELEETAQTAGGLLRPSVHTNNDEVDTDDEESVENTNEDTHTQDKENNEVSDQTGSEESTESENEDDLLSGFDDEKDEKNSDLNTMNNLAKNLNSISITPLVQESEINKIVKMSTQVDNKVLLWRKLCITQQDYLYRSKVFNIFINSNYSKNVGQLSLRIDNLHTTSSLVDISFEIPTVQGLVTNFSQNQINKILPNSSATTNLQIFCQNLPLQTPRLNLNISLLEEGKPLNAIQMNFNLPVVLTKFTTPYTLNAETSQLMWQNLGNEQRFQGQTKVDISSMISILTQCFNFYHFQAPTYHTFASAYSPSGQPQPTDTYILCQIIPSQQVGFTNFAIRASNPTISQMIRNILSSYLIDS